MYVDRRKHELPMLPVYGQETRLSWNVRKLCSIHREAKNAVYGYTAKIRLYRL